MLKGIFKDTNGFIQLLLLLVIIIFTTTVSYFLMMLLVAFKYADSPAGILEVMQHLSDYPACMREFVFISQLGTFIFPPLIAAYLFSDDYKKYLRLDTPINGRVALWTFLSMILIFPALNFITQLNQQVTFPEALKGFEKWLRDMEEQQTGPMEVILHAENIGAFIYNILIIAVFAAIGEEFTFRGVFQNIFGRFFHNKHVVIWSVAILFSAFHLQFFGFVPRMLLGAYLGYLLLYSRNMWIPVLAHFTNNFIGVSFYRIYQDKPAEMDVIDSIGCGDTWYLSVASVALFVFAFWQIVRYAKNQT
jgi:membrane protease YdiL (CAAX protease family)